MRPREFTRSDCSNAPIRLCVTRAPWRLPLAPLLLSGLLVLIRRFLVELSLLLYELYYYWKDDWTVFGGIYSDPV